MKSLKLSLGLLLVAVGMTLSTASAYAWGGKGHEITCAIAEKHLTKKAKKQISEILDGKSIVYYASWMDRASNQPEYRYTKTWHYMNVDAGETYESMPRNENGDCITGINSQLEALKSGKLNHEAEALALKFLIHMVADMHCPMHMGHLSDLGGNKIQVQYFRQGKNLHSVWDSGIIDSAHKWGYSEYADMLDVTDKAKIAEITKGSIDDWAKATIAVVAEIYDSTPVGADLGYDYVNRWTPTVEEQLTMGGLRLAKILNELFK